MKHLVMWLIVMLALVLSFNVLGVPEEECVAGGGEWIIPLNVDPREGDQRSPYCQCNQGYTWNGAACTKISAEILCKNSDGVWADESCQCPEESIGWNDKAGCDYRENLENSAVSLSDSKLQYPLITILLILLLIGILIYLFSRKKKKRNGGEPT